MKQCSYCLRLSKVSRWLIAVASLPLAIVLAYLLFTSGDSHANAPKLISVQFLGYTNNTAGHASPQFSISNVTSFSLQCTAIGAMSQVTNIVRGRSTNIAWGWAWGHVAQAIQPEETITYTVQAPPAGTSWRLGVFVMKPPGRWQRAVEKYGSRLPPRLYLALRGSGRATEYVQSGLFTNGPPH